jgi:hypothetical protein
MKTKQGPLPFSNLTQVFSLPLFIALSQEKAPLLGISFGALPGPSEHVHGLSARFSTMSSGYFSNISFYLSNFEQEGD